MFLFICCANVNILLFLHSRQMHWSQYLWMRGTNLQNCLPSSTQFRGPTQVTTTKVMLMVQSFLQAGATFSLHFTIGRSISHQKLPLLLGDLDPHLVTFSLDPMPLATPNGISTASSYQPFFVRYTIMINRWMDGQYCRFCYILRWDTA